MAHAGGPRFVTGTTFPASDSGVPIAFRTPRVQYYTDLGPLSATVNHAEAEAMVAGAAAGWNIPTASLTLSQGGNLAEDVSSANVTPALGGIALPADAAPSNYLSKPIAVIYDADGSVIDLLLGVTGSDPSGCRQNGAVESVDRFGPAGTIDHAIILVNGRCATGTGPPLLQLQYQVERAFGRVLGLAWSQVNDNVFSGSSPVTAAQIGYWPIMHPVDVICGLYTYQCLTSPFTLRSDDRSALAQLYPVTPGNLTAGKALSTSNAATIRAFLQFPTGQGMDMVNVTVRRLPIGTNEIEPYQIAAGVSGMQYQQVFATAVRGPVSDTDNTGTAYGPAQSQLNMTYLEVGTGGATLFMSTEPINPLYTGESAIGPYRRPPVTPSGSVQYFQNDSLRPGGGQTYTITFADAAATCSPGNDGVERAPVASDSSGWWNGQLCSVGHTSWFTAAIKGGRSWTVEADALDETGALTVGKAQPVIGVWKSIDGLGTLPTVAVTDAAMNAHLVGVTQIRMPVTAPDASFRVAIADQYGGGRPDFLYRARLLVADSSLPSVVAAGGGQITITGRGFQPGMQVLVNGVAGTVVSATATTIVARVPTMAAAQANGGAPLPVTVRDSSTGALSTIIDALRYSPMALNTLLQVSAPAALKTGLPAGTAFAVQVLAADGTTPVPGASVRLAVTTGMATLSQCGTASSCTVTSDASGMVQTTVTGGAAGPVSLDAVELSSGAAVLVNLIDTDPVRTATIADPPRFVAAGAMVGWTFTLAATEEGAPAAGVPVVWSASAGGSLTTTNSTTNAEGTGTNTVSVGSAPGGTRVSITGCVWTTVCATWTVQVVDPSQWTLAVASGAGQSGSVGTTFDGIVFSVTDAAGHPVEAAPVTLYQTVDAWEGACPEQGRCAAAPVLAATKTIFSTDAAGTLRVTPLRVDGVPQVINLAAVAGATGFVTLSLPVTP